MNDDPAVNDFGKVLSALFQGFPGCPDSGEIRNFAIVRFFILDEFVPGPGTSGLDIFDDHGRALFTSSDLSFEILSDKPFPDFTTRFSPRVVDSDHRGGPIPQRENGALGNGDRMFSRRGLTFEPYMAAGQPGIPVGKEP
jgi:hypothetical protein